MAIPLRDITRMLLIDSPWSRLTESAHSRRSASVEQAAASPEPA
jgi:hypothetical protein